MLQIGGTTRDVFYYPKETVLVTCVGEKLSMSAPLRWTWILSVGTTLGPEMLFCMPGAPCATTALYRHCTPILLSRCETIHAGSGVSRSA